MASQQLPLDSASEPALPARVTVRQLGEALSRLSREQLEPVAQHYFAVLSVEEQARVATRVLETVLRQQLRQSVAVELQQQLPTVVRDWLQRELSKLLESDQKLYFTSDKGYHTWATVQELLSSEITRSATDLIKAEISRRLKGAIAMMVLPGLSGPEPPK